MIPDYEKFLRETPPTIPMDRRIGIAEVEKILSRIRRAAASGPVSEVPRGAGIQRGRMYSLRRLRGYLPGVLPASRGRGRSCRQRGSSRRPSVARYGHEPDRGEQGAIIKDETRCIRCGLCAARCPTGAITMERVEYIPA